MKVLEINSVAGKQSTGQIVSDVKRRLIELGHECVIAYGEKDSPDQSGNYLIGNEFDRYFHAAKARLFDSAGFESKATTRRFIRWIKEYSPDVVHIHNIHGYYLNLELLCGFLSQSDIPVLFTLHDCWAFTGHCSHFSLANCEKWKTQCEHCQLKGEYPKSVFIDNSRNNYCRKKKAFQSISKLTITTPSAWLAKEVHNSFLSESEITVIQNGIDLTIFKPRKTDLKEKLGLLDKKVILGVANKWVNHKGISDFVELAKIIGEDYQIVLVGDPLGAVSKDSGIMFVGSVNDRELMAEYYSCASVYVNLSYGETQGLTIVEALACGTPAVVYNNTAMPEMIDCSCGIAVENGNIAEVKKAIERATALSYEDCISFSKSFDYRSRINHYAETVILTAAK